eukprot:6214357-Pleurochrysis_carterae.AAC.3
MDMNTLHGCEYGMATSTKATAAAQDASLRRSRSPGLRMNVICSPASPAVPRSCECAYVTA